MDSIYAIIFVLLLGQCIARDYEFQVYISTLLWSGTVDEIFFRLCNENEICGMFQSVPAGWQIPGQTYNYIYSTNTDIGDIYRVDIVHPGSDMLCIGHVIIDGVEYDENGHKWVDLPHCIEEADGGGCDTVSIILPYNDWQSLLTIPCEYESILDATYTPSLSPSHSPIPYPTNYPSPSPSNRPSKSPVPSPTISPSDRPSRSPIPSPTEAPSDLPLVSPTQLFDATQAGNINTGGKQQSVLTNSDTSDSAQLVSTAIITGLCTLVLGLCCIAIILVCYKKMNKNMDEGLDEDAESNVSHDDADIVLEGVSTANINTTGTIGTYDKIDENVDDANLPMIRNEEDMQLIADDSQDDSDDAEELYDDERRNRTRMDERDQDENILPQ